MRGRKPKPSAIRELEGNPGHRPLNEHEPRPDVAAPDCPKHLKKEAKREWERIVPQLAALGALTRIDRAALSAYCTAWADYVEADAQVRKHGLVIKTKSGNVIQNPFLGVRNTALKMMAKFAVEFGLTPSSRTRIAASPAGPVDDIDEFLNDDQPPMRIAK